MSAPRHPDEPTGEPGPVPDPAQTRPSLYRRLLGGTEGREPDGADDTLEAELAERLDTVLNIAERLAAT
ncbi:MAG TPA: hypothetical protein VM408_06260, partial [Methylomirabilota bacterium]|nr:hypothetical protein [Methylomirabilota bacterium]